MIASTQTNHPLSASEESPQPNARIETACARLRSSGLRITQPRIAILNTLIKHESPISIEQIHDELHNKSCDLVTVYRCLAAFEDIGLVRRSFFHNGTSLYEMSDSRQILYHVVNKDTGEINPLGSEVCADLAAAIGRVEAILQNQGYSDVSHIVEFFAKSSRKAVSTQSRGVSIGVSSSL